MKLTKIVASAAAALLLAGCGASGIEAGSTSSAPEPAASTTSAAATETPTDDPVVDPTPSETEGGFSTTKFGTTASFTQADTNAFTVNVGKPVKAKCQYSYSGCAKPETGDRVITTKVVIKNKSKEPIEISYDLFVLEFADGTRMEPSDGSAIEYQPDNAMDYGHKIRPGGTYTSTLTFEAPKGPFTVIMLTGSYDGEDLHGWN